MKRFKSMVVFGGCLLTVGWLWSGLEGLASLGEIRQLQSISSSSNEALLSLEGAQLHDMIDTSEPREIEMTVNEVMAALEDMGTEQNQKVYKRHGAKEPLFGVSFANLKKLKKSIKKDHNLALQLWDTKNVDAQLLACMVADAEQVTLTQANAWINDTSYYALADEVGDLVAHSPSARKLMDKWMKSKKEFVKQGGYTVLSSLLRKDPSQFSQAECETFLDTIATEIHNAPNRARYTMNVAVIAFGAWHPECADMAVETAKRIGKVDVDHGDTNCKTPDAASYIEKTLAYQKAKTR